MSLIEKIKQEISAALKEGKATELSVLRMVNAAVQNKEKEKRYRVSKEKPDLSEVELQKESQLGDEEIMDVIAGEAKKRRESIIEFEKGGRADLVSKEKTELEVLKKYLPEQMSEEDLRKLITEAIKKTGAESLKDMGKIMQELMPKIKGKADGGLVSKIVKESLEK
jgi:hypothetical protein